MIEPDEGVRLRRTLVDRERSSVPCGCPHRKLEPTDVTLSSHAEKLAVFWPRIWSLDGIKVEVSRKHKLVI